MFIAYKDIWRNYQPVQMNLIMLYEDNEDSSLYVLYH